MNIIGIIKITPQAKLIPSLFSFIVDKYKDNGYLKSSLK